MLSKELIMKLLKRYDAEITEGSGNVYVDGELIDEEYLRNMFDEVLQPIKENEND
jgi:hypothetical protein